MPPEMYEQEGDIYRLDDIASEPEYLGAPTEYAEEAEVSEAVGMLATIAAGIGLATPVLIGLMTLVFGCVVCVAIVVAAWLA